jgi:hypothetical protein
MTSYVVSTPVNGTFTVPDDLINTSQTALNLIGRGVTNYGQAVAENDINLLQNFAGPTSPVNPLIGQLWYDNNVQQLCVLTGPATWSALAMESELANYATESDFQNLSAAVNSLSANAVTKDQLSLYVTAAELYTPTGTPRVVPVKSGGTGLSALGQPGQMLVVNGLQTGLTYASPQNFYRRPFVSANSTKTLTASQLGSIVNITASGVTINLPPAVQCQQGTSFIFTLLVTGGSVTITAAGTDYILGGKAAQGNTYTMYAGEDLEIASDGALGWVATSQSKTTAVTMPAGDSSLNLANTAFVTTAIATAVSGLQTYGNGRWAPINSPAFTGTPTAPTPTTGDNSTNVATTAFVTTATNAVKVGFTPVQQGGGVGQGTNKVYIGWSGSGLLCTVDSSNIGRILFQSDFDNLQNQINTKAPASQPYAYTGINQTVYFWDVHANGTIYSANDIWAFASDERLKEKIVPITNALAKLHQISGVLYNFTAEAQKLSGIDSKRRHMGFLAGEMEKIAPEVVGPAPFDIDKKTGKSISGKNYKTIQYEKAVPLVAEAVKELDDKVETLKTQIEDELTDMRAKIAYLMSNMERLLGDDK